MTTDTRPPLRLEYVDPSTLTPNPANWRRHPPAQIAALQESLGRVGWAGALLFNERTGRLVDGHARLEGAVEPVPVLVGNWTEDEEALILASLDPIGAMAEADFEQLAALLPPVLDFAGADGLEALAALLETLQPPAEPSAPDNFPLVDENLATEHTCPKCGFKFSGGA